MSKKFNSIKKGLTEAIEDADGGALGTRIHRPRIGCGGHAVRSLPPG